MIEILVLIVSLNAIHCQIETEFCELMKTNGRYEGIQVFRSSVQNEDLMYKNGKQWRLRFGGKGIEMHFQGMNPSCDKSIINRFSGNGFDCEVRYQLANNSRIETNCFTAATNITDKTSQYSPKDIIFRASNTSDNQWIVIYNKKLRNISCYSPQETTQKLVTNKTKCKQLIGRNQTVIEAIDPSIVKSIDVIVENPSGNVIHGYYIFFRRDGRPVFCDKSMFDPKNRCKSETDIKEKKTSPKDTK